MEQRNGYSSIKLTKEQIAIIQSKGSVRINAIAGSGKTTTIVEYAATRPGNPSILYLAFNKSVRLEATRKFEAKGLSNVRVETAHSLAYKQIVFQHNYKVRGQGYKNGEIVDMLRLKGNGDKHSEYVIATHINKFLSYYCNSSTVKIMELNYLETLTDKEAIQFVTKFYTIIENGARAMLNKMNSGEIEITHDFYLKKFQLVNPILYYDYILFDEAQDASGVMLDVILKQEGTKVIVGDVHQQIYGWRHAVNSLEKANFDLLRLSTSFRYVQDVANLASEILFWKNHLAETKKVTIFGQPKPVKLGNLSATIARTNLGLLLNAIDFITDHPKVKHIYFEGNINSYTYADDGTSLYDVLNLQNGNLDRVNDKVVKSMRNLEELEEYIEKTEDVQLGTMVEIVKEYGNEIFGIMKKLKALHVGDDQRHKAEMVFSTVHRAKGMEYDTVYLVNDFIAEEKLKELNKKEEADVDRLIEEVNLLYVAVTRTKGQLNIPETLVPAGFPGSPYINVLKVKAEGNPYNNIKSSSLRRLNKHTPEDNKAKTFIKKREAIKETGKPWSARQDEELKIMFEKGMPVSRLTVYFDRTKGAILERLKKLGYYLD